MQKNRIACIQFCPCTVCSQGAAALAEANIGTCRTACTITCTSTNAMMTAPLNRCTMRATSPYCIPSAWRVVFRGNVALLMLFTPAEYHVAPKFAYRLRGTQVRRTQLRAQIATETFEHAGVDGLLETVARVGGMVRHMTQLQHERRPVERALLDRRAP